MTHLQSRSVLKMMKRSSHRPNPVPEFARKANHWKKKWQLQPISYHQLVKHGSWTKLMPIWKWNPLSKFLEGLSYYKSSEWKTTHVTPPIGEVLSVAHMKVSSLLLNLSSSIWAIRKNGALLRLSQAIWTVDPMWGDFLCQVAFSASWGTSATSITSIGWAALGKPIKKWDAWLLIVLGRWLPIRVSWALSWAPSSCQLGTF